MTLSPLYTYAQALVNQNRDFTLHMLDGNRLQVPAGNASLTTSGALLVKSGNRMRAINESAIAHIEHDGNPAE